MLCVQGLISAIILVKLPVITGQCGGSVRNIDLAYGQNGVIRSPNYPYSYGSYENCKWHITAPYGQKVLFYFTSLDLRACCSCDYVQIYDGSNYFGRVLTKGCNSSFPPPVHSSNRNIYMEFRSDWTQQGQGFEAHYQALRKGSGCPSIDPAASAGVIYSPNFPWNYPHSTSCNWRITTQSSLQRIHLTFMTFNLEAVGCSDYVEVRDAYSVYRRKLCGYHAPNPISLYGTMIVTFSSDSFYSRSGFMAFYQIGKIYTLATTAPNYYTPTPFPYTPYTAQPYFTTRTGEYGTEKATTVKATAIAVPLVVGVVLFGIIFAVINLTKITRSAGPAGISSANQLSAQPLSQRIEPSAPFAIREQYPPYSTAQSLSPNTVSNPLTPATGYSQGLTNMSLEGDSEQM